jgi:hypothetical protein
VSQQRPTTTTAPPTAPPGGATATLRRPPARSAAGVPAPARATERPDSGADGIGDIAQAGRPSGYAHLRARGSATIGGLSRAAERAAAALARPTLWPRRTGHWQHAPRSVRQGASGRVRVTVVRLEPNGFVSVPGDGGDVLRVAHGRAHLVATGTDGSLLSVRDLVPDRTRVLGGGGRKLVNTGAGPALVVRVAG